MGLWSRLARTFRRRRHDAEIAEELQFHLDMDVADGHTAREARIRLGGVTRTLLIDNAGALVATHDRR